VPVAKPLTEPCDVVYLYDGSMPGLFCCIFESVYTHEFPFAIQAEGEAQMALFFKKRVETNTEKAQRVMDAVMGKVSPRAFELMRTVFYSCLKEKEIALLRFALLAFSQGPKVMEMLAHPDVATLLEAEHHLLREGHLLTGFVRFSDCDGKLVAAISPKNFILPFIAEHFADRFRNETFAIYDKTHKAALYCQNGKMELVQLEDALFPEASEDEEQYRSLWRQFYKTVAIEDRYNPKCRMTHMPKRYWENMTEMQDLL
jgi:probable DNA metabolism protein